MGTGVLQVGRSEERATASEAPGGGGRASERRPPGGGRASDGQNPARDLTPYFRRGSQLIYIYMAEVEVVRPTLEASATTAEAKLPSVAAAAMTDATLVATAVVSPPCAATSTSAVTAIETELESSPAGRRRPCTRVRAEAVRVCAVDRRGQSRVDSGLFGRTVGSASQTRHSRRLQASRSEERADGEGQHGDRTRAQVRSTR